MPGGYGSGGPYGGDGTYAYTFGPVAADNYGDSSYGDGAYAFAPEPVTPDTGFYAYTVPIATGLEGIIGVRIINSTTTVVARSTTYIAEYPDDSGIYEVPLEAPTTEGRYLIVWDYLDADSVVRWGAEDLVVRENA